MENSIADQKDDKNGREKGKKWHTPTETLSRRRIRRFIVRLGTVNMPCRTHGKATAIAPVSTESEEEGAVVLLSFIRFPLDNTLFIAPNIRYCNHPSGNRWTRTRMWQQIQQVASHYHPTSSLTNIPIHYYRFENIHNKKATWVVSTNSTSIYLSIYRYI